MDQDSGPRGTPPYGKHPDTRRRARPLPHSLSSTARGVRFGSQQNSGPESSRGGTRFSSCIHHRARVASRVLRQLNVTQCALVHHAVNWSWTSTLVPRWRTNSKRTVSSTASSATLTAPQPRSVPQVLLNRPPPMESDAGRTPRAMSADRRDGRRPTITPLHTMLRGLLLDSFANHSSAQSPPNARDIINRRLRIGCASGMPFSVTYCFAPASVEFWIARSR